MGVVMAVPMAVGGRRDGRKGDSGGVDGTVNTDGGTEEELPEAEVVGGGGYFHTLYYPKVKPICAGERSGKVLFTPNG
jgi:hypothetical protein